MMKEALKVRQGRAGARFIPAGFLLCWSVSPFEENPMSTRLYENLIGGEWVPSRTGKTFLSVNPADSDHIVGEFQSSGAELGKFGSPNSRLAGTKDPLLIGSQHFRVVDGAVVMHLPPVPIRISLEDS